jgi:hypothetical protein
MNTTKTTTVLVRRQRGIWTAAVGLHERCSHLSATVAAQEAAAAHFGVARERIDLVALSGHTLRASVKPTPSAIAWDMLLAASAALAAGVAVVLMLGGGR